MIYITGDTHGEIERFMNSQMGDDDWGKDDTLIICGDFGFLFLDNKRERKNLDVLAEKPYTICFVDGNHENFPAIYAHRREKWKGGYVNKLRDNVFHLMRGEIFEIEGKSIFVMGGGYSIDKEYRTEGYSWWSQEMPLECEYRNADANLARYNNKVDLIITHTAPMSVILDLKSMRHPKFAHVKDLDPHEGDLNRALDIWKDSVEFKHWYFGHWHADARLGKKYTAVYYDVHTVDF